MSPPLPNELLNSDELRSLTGYAVAGRQEKFLKDAGIPYRLRGRTILVSRVHMRDWLSGKVMISSGGPNWAAIS